MSFQKHISLTFLTVWLVGTAAVDSEEPAAGSSEKLWSVDFRYAPPWWQTSICLPDDWQKTLVGKDGSLLYDFPGKYAGFKTKITGGLAGGAEWVSQTLASPRIPIPRTVKRNGMIELEETAFAVAPNLPAAKNVLAERLGLERVGPSTDLIGWAHPKGVCDPAFAKIAVGWIQPVCYRFKAAKEGRYLVALGLCEGHHQEAGQRILDLQIEGKTRKTVDMVAEKGQNVPALFPFEAADENGDGWIEVRVSAAANSKDPNTILNVLWIFDGSITPDMKELLVGQSSKPALAHVDCGGETAVAGPARNDIVILRLRNKGASEAAVRPVVTIESEFPILADKAEKLVSIGGGTVLTAAPAFQEAKQSNEKVELQFEPVRLAAGAEHVLAIGCGRSVSAPVVPESTAQAEELAKRAERYWREEVDLPYGHIEVPDSGVQALLDSSIRNIYQAREIKNGLPAFQVGPTCYRGLWVVDGSFLMEAVAFLNREQEARDGIRYLMSFQQANGAFMLIDGHWKETGIALWALTRHARLTGGREWLSDVWPKVEGGFAYIRTMRKEASSDPKALNAGLIPAGFSDGGLSGKHAEYTNVYWTLAGMKGAVEAARWLGKNRQADEWQREYDDFYATFRRAAKRDERKDAHGNVYVPTRMGDNERTAPQRAQWAFLHAVFPGKVFAADDPLVAGNLAMLRAAEKEGLIYGTGWLADGIWNYFGSFYAHALLWVGQGQKAAEVLYAFGNHASPLLTWREEHMPAGKGDKICGDMPHNWASAEFVRLVRHLLVLERGDELHLFEGLPAKWVRPGAVIRLRDVLTEFGPISLELRVSEDGSKATVMLPSPSRRNPVAIVLHLDGWSGNRGTVELPTTTYVEREIALKR